jgi:hypothetical protein
MGKFRNPVMVGEHGLDTHKKKTHRVVTKNMDEMDLYTMRENDNYN